MDEVEVIADVAQEAKSELPLVTLALFAYNQEKYIREAVEGALAQDYPNLEIVISDDASLDETWKEVQSCLAAYQGRHEIKLNRNERNLGVTSHVNKVVSLSNGRLLVMAAGDDISKTNRVSRLVDVWRKNDCCIGLLHSSAQPMDEAGHEILQPMRGVASHSDSMSLPFFQANRHRMLIHGATAAYTRELFETYGPMTDGGLVEDAVMTFRAALCGKLLFVEEPLVQYRVSSTSISGTVYSVREPERWLRWMSSQEMKVRNHISDYAKHVSQAGTAPAPKFLRYLNSTADGFAQARKMVAPSWFDRVLGVAMNPGLRSIRDKVAFARKFYA